MTGDRARWVAELGAAFHLRGRASRDEYRLGRALAETDAVRLMTLDPGVVVALVADGALRRVVLREESDAIVATCSCGTERQVCRHAVAVEHAIWLRSAPPDEVAGGSQ